MTNDNRDAKRTLFDYVSSYHELLAIIVFLISGVVWTVGYFATKSELRELQNISEKQIERLQCLLRLNIEWLAGEQLWKIINDDLTKIEQDIRALTQLAGVPDVANLSRIVDLERQREEKKKDIDIARKGLCRWFRYDQHLVGGGHFSDGDAEEPARLVADAGSRPSLGPPSCRHGR